MGRWIFKWNRRDRSLPEKANDWSIAFTSTRPLECYGRAEGRGGENLATLAPGNLALAYQSDDGAFYGVVRVLHVHSAVCTPFLVVERTCRFPHAVKLTDLVAKQPLLGELGAFSSGGAESMRRLRPDEFRMVLDGCGIDEAARTRMRI